ncbi:MAG: 4a-hydroxytetrahydrobiopterin dehydratase [Verrucomicrobia bacterium]|nr:4a-hydroxytetrahydrobiopterin dehydratase [Verrucomicrobiota bacterium]
MKDNPNASDWVHGKCTSCEKGATPLSDYEVEQGVNVLEDWNYTDGWLERVFTFENYFQTVSFVNAIAWIAHRQNHHPDIELSYKTCKVRYRTHAIDGISDNDFICAAKVDAMLRCGG